MPIFWIDFYSKNLKNIIMSDNENQNKNSESIQTKFNQNLDKNLFREMVLKKVENHTKNGKTKRIRFGVTDKEIFNSDKVYVFNPAAYNDLLNAFKENQSNIIKLESDLKKALENNVSNQDDYISKNELKNIEKNYKKTIENLEKKLKESESKNKENISELNAKDNLINELNIKIENIKADETNKANKECLDKYNNAINDKERLNDKYKSAIEDKEKESKQLNNQITELEKRVLYYANQYNQLLNSVNNINLFSFINGKLKAINNDYQEIKILNDNPNMYIQTKNNESANAPDDEPNKDE